jgi:excisionase family DNA binding protein
MSEQSREQKNRSEFLTAGQLAKMLQISETSVHRLRRQGKIPAVMLTPRLIRFNLRDVRAALAAQQPDVTSDTVRVDERSDSRQLAFDDLFLEQID